MMWRRNKAKLDKNGQPVKKVPALQAYRRMLRLAKPEWRRLAIGTVFLFVGSLANLAYPLAVSEIVDKALAGGLKAIDQAAIAMGVIFLIMGAATAFRYYLFTVAGYRIVTKLQHDTYDRIMHQEVGFFDQRKTGELLNRLSSDTTVLQNTVSVNISMLLRHSVVGLGAVVFLFLISAKLTVIMLALVPPVSMGAVYFGRIIRRLSRVLQDALAKAGEVAEETIAGIRTVRAFAREPLEVERYGSSVEEAYLASKHRATGAAIFQGVVSFAAYGAIALVVWYGGKLVVNDEISVGKLTSFILYTLTVSMAVGALSALWADFMRALGAAERIFEITDREPEIGHGEGKVLENVNGKLEFDHVEFAYPSRPDVRALHDVSFTVEPGEVIALVGHSGSGKSTIANLIPRFYDPTAGQILIDGHRLDELEPQWLRRQIGIVSQEPVLFSTTIAANILYGVDEVDEVAMTKAAKMANAHDFIVSFPDGYQTQVGERGIQLSGGQKQRVAIARAILHNPKILVLDEATSALDAESEYFVQQALDRLMLNRTTLIIAHRLSTVRDANRVLVMSKGRLAEMGPHEALMAKPDGMYRKLVERQFLTDPTVSTAP